MKTRTLGLTLFAAALLALVVGLWTWSSSTKNLGTENAETKNAGTEPTIVHLDFRLNWFPGGEHSYLYYGEELGYFKEAGVNLSIVGGRGSELAAKLVGSGDADLALISADTVLIANSAGAQIRSIGVIYDHTPATIYSITDPPLTNLKDLYGKRLGVLPGSNTFTQYQALCEAHDIDRTKITERQVNGAAAPGLLLAGELDALMFYTHHAPVKARQLGKPVSELLFRNLGLDIYGMTLAARQELNTRVDLTALTTAVVRSLAASRKNPDAAIAAMSKIVKLKDPTYELGKLKRFLGLVYADGFVPMSQNNGRWTNTASQLTEMGAIPNTEVAANVMIEH